jgi:murein DD-endopeptidase MepM/ murein hydrolase activator NlpD
MLKKVFYLGFILFCLMILRYLFLFNDFSPKFPPPSSPYLKWPLKKEKKKEDINLCFGDDWVKNCGCYPKKHTGIDIKANPGDEVMAAKEGKILVIFPVKAADGGGGGNGIVIGHGEFTTVYIHVVPLINVGQYVEKGQIIAKIAKIKSYHLHFGIRLAKYDKYSTRGALPQKNTPDDKYCKGDPVFPDHFIDPFKLKYD